MLQKNNKKRDRDDFINQEIHQPKKSLLIVKLFNAITINIILVSLGLIKFFLIITLESNYGKQVWRIKRLDID